MPFFRFTTDAGPQGSSLSVDRELPSIRDAQFEAVRYLGKLLSHDGLEFWAHEEALMKVTTPDGEKLFALKLALD